MYMTPTEEALEEAWSHERALSSALRENHRVLRALVEECHDLFEEWRSSLPELEIPKARKANYRVIPSAALPERLMALMQVSYHFEHMHLQYAFAHRNSDFAKEAGGKSHQAYAQQFSRLLSLTGKIVATILEDMDKEDLQFGSRIDRVRWALFLTKLAVERTYAAYDLDQDELHPGFERYRHPEAQHWVRMHAKCKRGLHALFLSSARFDEAVAKEMKPFPYAKKR